MYLFITLIYSIYKCNIYYVHVFKLTYIYIYRGNITKNIFFEIYQGTEISSLDVFKSNIVLIVKLRVCLSEVLTL